MSNSRESTSFRCSIGWYWSEEQNILAAGVSSALRFDLHISDKEWCALQHCVIVILTKQQSLWFAA